MIANGFELLMRGICEHVINEADAERLLLKLAEFEKDLAEVCGVESLRGETPEQITAANLQTWKAIRQSTTS